MNKIIKMVKSEFDGFGKFEIVAFTCIVIAICFLSYISGDSKIALFSAICGISYTILAGKGKVSCYYIGVTGSFCYAYLSYINGFYGNLVLYAFYYIPMQIVGIFKWSKHLKTNESTIEKTKLKTSERNIYSLLAILFSLIGVVFLKFLGDKNPVIDAFTTVLSVFGLFLTVRRCVEQWYIWFIVNFLTLIMWVIAYKAGANCLSTVLMWLVYLVLSIYFLKEWKKEMLKN